MDSNLIQATAALSAQLNLNVQSNNVQQQISQLPISQVLLGLVAGNDKNGNTIIRLAGNDLVLSSPIALAKNAQIALKLEMISSSLIAELLSIDGKLPPTQPQKVSYQVEQNPEEENQQAESRNQNSQSQNSLAQNSPNQNQPASQNSAPILRVVSVLPQGAAKIAEPVNLPPNTNIIADTVELSSPSAAPLNAIVIAPAPEIMQTIHAKLGLSDDNKLSPELEESLPDEITAGTNLKVKITSADTSPQSPAKGQIATDNTVLAKPDWMKVTDDAETVKDNAPENLQNQNSQSQNSQSQTSQTTLQSKLQNFTPQLKAAGNGNITLNGMVLHSEPNGELLLQTALGKLLLNAGPKFSALEKGAVLNLELSDISVPDETAATINDDTPLTNLTKQWPALQALGDQASASGVPLLEKLAGLSDAEFAARLDGFANAVRSGNIRDWLGNNYLDMLAAMEDGPDILSKLRADLDTLRENFAAPNPNGWQTMLFPIFDGQQLNQARLHIKYLPDHNNKSAGGGGTRFMVEIDTSYFGEIQMDGLVRTSMAKNFDLMIRTHDPLEMEVKHDINQIFTDAGEVTGFKGNIEFSVMREFPNNILGQQREQNLSAKIDHKGIEA